MLPSDCSGARDPAGHLLLHSFHLALWKSWEAGAATITNQPIIMANIIGVSRLNSLAKRLKLSS